MLQASEEACDTCSKVLSSEMKQRNKSTTKKAKPVKGKAPIAGCSKKRLIATVQQQRMKCEKLKGKLSAQEKDISSQSITVNESLEKDILDIMGSTDLKQTPHIELFWKQLKEITCIPKVWQTISSPPDSILPICPCQISICISRTCIIWRVGLTKR